MYAGRAPSFSTSGTASWPVAAQSTARHQPAADVLTAASVADVDRRENYLGYLSRHQELAEILHIDATRRLRIRAVDDEGNPLGNATVTLEDSQGAQVQARTHADGWWDYLPGLNARVLQGAVRVTVHDPSGQARELTSAVVPGGGDGETVLVTLRGVRRRAPRVLDLGFAIDVTGSMGDELRYVNRELDAIVRRVHAHAPDVLVRVGAVFYRDRGDSQPVQAIDFTSDIEGFVGEMDDVSADGGGDYPEDMSAGLRSAMRDLSWTPRADAARVLVLVADAPPKEYADANYTWRDAMFDAARNGVRILPVAASGADRTVEYIFRAMGTATSTPYVYLTDDSGVGNAHVEADTDRVVVEGFARLLERLVIADLRGEGMHELDAFGPRMTQAVAAR